MITRTLGGIPLIRPNQWDESYSVVETVNTSEAGTDLVDVVRSNKLTVSTSFNCSSRWYKIFAELSERASLILNSYDPLTGANKNRTVRMRDFQGSFQRYSDNLDGMWVVSFTLIEF